MSFKKTYICGNDQVIAEYDYNDVSEEYDLARKFIYGPGIDEPICMIDVADNNAVYYYHFDGLGSVVAITNANANVIESYSYDVFGQPSTTSSVGNPYMFTGRRFDEETSLYYYRARYYDPWIGRFLQTDPIGYYGGLNLYTYVANNPLSWIDPWGLCKEEALDKELEELIETYKAKMREIKTWRYKMCYEYQDLTMKMGLDTEHYELRKVYGHKTWLGIGRPRMLFGIERRPSQAFVAIYHIDDPDSAVIYLDPFTPGIPSPWGTWYHFPPWSRWVWRPWCR